MRLWALVGFAMLVAGCGGGTDAPATIERHVSSDPVDDPITHACDEVEDLALGAMDGETELLPIVEELARLGALAGATAALPHLAQLKDALAEGSNQTARPLAAAADALDVAGYEMCEIPIFTALYVSSSFSSCFGRAGITAGELAPATEGCEADVAPEFLPCFDPEQGYVPIDCRTGEPVRLIDGEWVAV